MVSTTSAIGSTVERVVDDRVLLLGLDEMYRSVVKTHESGDLLDCARVLGRLLRVQRDSSAPVEGYYGETPLLTEYLQWTRALQAVSAERAQEVVGTTEYQRLVRFASSPHLGRATSSDKLLPRARDPLSVAPWKLRPTWTVPALVKAAKQAVLDLDDWSLVGLAAFVEDDVALTALRETAVLYAEVIFTGLRVRNEFVWRVTPALAERAARSVDSVNALLDEDLPAHTPASANSYWQAHVANKIEGRCVRIGSADWQDPPRHYHWAIKRRGAAHRRRFLDARVWTTDTYKRRAPEA